MSREPCQPYAHARRKVRPGLRLIEDDIALSNFTTGDNSGSVDPASVYFSTFLMHIRLVLSHGTYPLWTAARLLFFGLLLVPTRHAETFSNFFPRGFRAFFLEYLQMDHDSMTIPAVVYCLGFVFLCNCLFFGFGCVFSWFCTRVFCCKN